MVAGMGRIRGMAVNIIRIEFVCLIDEAGFVDRVDDATYRHRVGSGNLDQTLGV